MKPGKPITEITDILVVRPDALGDLILVLPLVCSIKQTWPNCRITLLVQDYTAPILDQHPDIASVITVPGLHCLQDKSVAGKLLQTLQKSRFDAAFLPYLDFAYARLIRNAGIPIRIGNGQQLLPARLLTHRIPLNYQSLAYHEIEQNLRLLTAFHPQAHITYDAHIQIPDNAQTAITQMRRSAGLTADQLYGVAHVSFGAGNRTLSVSQWVNFIDAFQQRYGFPLILTGSENDRKLTADIIALSKFPPIDFTGKTSIPQLAALLKDSHFVMGTQTGPLHLAAALKRPILSISPTKFVKSLRWGPFQTACEIVTNRTACPLRCHSYTCQKTICSDAISIEAMLTPYTRLNQERHNPDALIKRLCASGTIGLLRSRHTPLPHWVAAAIAKGLQFHEFDVSDFRPWHIATLIRSIWQHDLILLHPLAPLPHWMRFVIQLTLPFSALGIYAPPRLMKAAQFADATEAMDNYLLNLSDSDRYTQ